MLELKQYQKRALDELRDYLSLAVAKDNVDTAFYELTHREYHPVAQLPGPPYVCLRVPTGGGKTLMACHSISTIAETFLRQERAVVLWLVPTNTIKDQTLSALVKREHPYRQALDFTLDGRVRAMDVEEALHIQKPVLDSETVIIVSTLANPRVGETDNRKLYEQNGDLGSHFAGCAPELLQKLDKYEDSDKPIPSLANVLRLRRPIVIMDEAHNARTELSFETLARFDPSCILEFTATPAERGPSPSNVLCRVSASELKAEHMIKLPIVLETIVDWRETLQSAVNKRDELEALANQEQIDGASYLRPIVLLQAQKKNEDIKVDDMRQCLVRDLGIPEAYVAVETGETAELKDVDVFSPGCQIRYIITVDKLREGWDCSFAYVLCSVRDMNSVTAIEQILGRVLRMPGAQRRPSPQLNEAYAFVTSPNFKKSQDIVDVLVASLETNGFTKEEARGAFQYELGLGRGGEGGLFGQDETPGVPRERKERFDVPELALWTDGELEQIEESHFLMGGWNLSQCDARLSEQEFPVDRRTGDKFGIDVNEEGKVESQYIDALQRQLALLIPCDIKESGQLAIWLDKHIPHPDVAQPESVAFLLRLVDHLTRERKIPLEQLARERLRLRDAAENRIDFHRRQSVQASYQQMLFGVPPAEIEVSASRVFTFDPDHYPVTALYTGGRDLRKHYYSVIGEMNAEEAKCAEFIAGLPQVKYWVRNLERRPDTSFWLQTGTDRFYPDFVVLLNDGRVIAVEYKGGQGLTTDDTREKVALGELWESKSNGKCLFRLVRANDFEIVLREIAG